MHEDRAPGKRNRGHLTSGLVCVAVLAVVLVACTSGVPTSRRVSIHVDHPRALSDTPIHITVTGLSPRQSVRIEAQARDHAGKPWTSEATFVADASGEVDLAQDAPSSGSYEGLDPMGLFWSMKPVGYTSGDYLFWVLHEADVALTVAGSAGVLARTTVVRLDLAAGVTSQNLRPGKVRFFGVYYAPASTNAPRPAVLAFGGSEGGLDTAGEARLLASHGYPALALAYFKEPGLPQRLERIPLEYFARAIRWLSAQPGVDPKKVIVYGASRGGEAALLLGAAFPELVHGVVALTPSNLTTCGIPNVNVSAWTIGGRPVPCSRLYGPRSHGQPDTVIPVERIDGPILLVCGVQDLVWPSCPMSKAVMARLRAHHDPYPHALLDFPDAGHAVNYPVPYRPFFFGIGGEGSTPQADPQARERTWPRILEFLSRASSD